MRDTAPTGRLVEHARVPALDLLRLVAVLMVATFHFGLQGPAGLVAVPGVEDVARYGFMGVPIFFVISGFVIAYSAEGRTATSFAIARFSRIYPTFLLCMTLTFLAVFFFGAPHFQASLAQWAANLVIVSPGHSYIDSAYWSLAVEAVFYTWITFFIWLGCSIRRCDAVLLLWLALSLLNELTVDIRFFGKTLMTDYSGFFATGILIYQMRFGKADARLRAVFAVAVMTGTYQAIHNLRWIRQETGTDFDEFTVATIFLVSVCFLLFAAHIRRLPINSTLLLALGGCTYPLYLLHQQLGYVAFMRMDVSAHPLFIATVTMFIISLLSLAVWNFFERPVQRWLRTFLAGVANKIVARAKPVPANS